jgi:hypothetical protein
MQLKTQPQEGEQLQKKRVERVERFTVKIKRPAIPERTAIRVLRNEIHHAIDQEGLPYGMFLITECKTVGDLQEFTVVHERSLEHENEMFERTEDPTPEAATKQLLGEYEDAKAFSGALWLSVDVLSRDVDLAGKWVTVASEGA